MGCFFVVDLIPNSYKGLYKGMFTSILGVAPYVAINFTTYETLKQRFETNQGVSVPNSLAFGAISGYAKHISAIGLS